MKTEATQPKINQTPRISRWAILAIGVFAMLFAGILYAWSILKTPFAEELGFTPQTLSLNYTLTMSFFCLGGVISGRIVRLIGSKWTIAAGGLLAGIGFALSSLVGSAGSVMLFVAYAGIAGLGIGVAYIAIISTVNAHFPDRKGLSSGALMMGFGASSLVLGNLADLFFKTSLGWRGTYLCLGAALGIVLLVASIFISPPAPTDAPVAQKRKSDETSDGTAQYTTKQMLCRFTFWRAFIGLVCLTAVGSTVISFARDLALSVGAEAALATTLVGVLAVFNGLGRIITGAVFDAAGRRFTMIGANVLTVCAAAVTLLAVSISSLPLCIVGLCLTGLSYGTSPTVSSTFVLSFYGQKNYANNLGVMNLNLMFASFVPTVCSSILGATGSYVAPFALLLALATLALCLSFTIKKP